MIWIHFFYDEHVFIFYIKIHFDYFFSGVLSKKYLGDKITVHFLFI